MSSKKYRKYIKYLESDEWKEKRLQVAKLKNYKCEKCGKEVKFGYHESIGVFAPKIRKIKEKDISTYKWQASFCNAPDDFTSEYDEDDNGYRFITHDNLGLPFLCRTMHITKDCLVQTT